MRRTQGVVRVTGAWWWGSSGRGGVCVRGGWEREGSGCEGQAHDPAKPEVC